MCLSEVVRIPRLIICPDCNRQNRATNELVLINLIRLSLFNTTVTVLHCVICSGRYNESAIESRSFKSVQTEMFRTENEKWSRIVQNAHHKSIPDCWTI